MLIDCKKRKNSRVLRGNWSIFAAALLVASVALGGCGKTTYTVEEHLIRGMAFADEGDLSSASIEYRNALRQDPSSSEGRYRLGLLLLQLGDAAGAEAELRRAKEFGVDLNDVRMPLLQSLLGQGKFGRIMDETRNIDDVAKDQLAQIKSMRGFALLGIGNPGEAEVIFREVLDIDPTLSDANLGMAYVSSGLYGDLDAAHKWVSTAIDSDSRSQRAWSYLGDIEQAMGRFESAERAFLNSIQLQSYVSLDRVKLALLRLQLGKIEEAEADIEFLKKSGLSDHYYVTYAGGLVYFSRGDYARAADAFEASYRSEPNFAANRLYLAASRLFLGNTERARQHANWLHANFQSSQAAARLIGALRLGSNEFLEAQNVLELAWRNNPEDSTTLSMLIMAYLLGGELEKGAEYAKKMTILEPDSRMAQELSMLANLMIGKPLSDISSIGVLNAEISDSDSYQHALLRALSAFRDNRFMDALEAANRLQGQYPDRADPFNLAAAVYLATGQWERARPELLKVLSLNPDDSMTAINLARLEVQAGNIQEANSILRKLLETHPGQENAWLLLADVKKRLGDAGGAIEVLQNAVNANPQSIVILNQLLVDYLREGELAKILEISGDLRADQWESMPSMLEVLGRAHMLLGNQALALDAFERWAELQPGSAEAYFLQADALSRAGRSVQAKQALGRAIGANPDHVMARIGEIRLLVQLGDVDRAREKV
ncbi:XrtA/PEP-CTERM system TPR-repeat protein PrsT, partial [Ectothiorhodospira lacustris]|uniref:XrtA/PEP-CTERM system TPR-repeat protein PrsT n=1 Tax=Ectothiorhodospira lacustris TaxID=2899127 RepID=UPI001EE7F773